MPLGVLFISQSCTAFTRSLNSLGSRGFCMANCEKCPIPLGISSRHFEVSNCPSSLKRSSIYILLNCAMRSSCDILPYSSSICCSISGAEQPAIIIVVHIRINFEIFIITPYFYFLNCHQSRRTSPVVLSKHR